MIEFADDAGEVAHAVVVGVEEGGGPYLVADGVFPPGVAVAGHSCGAWMNRR